jgi:hypothetical protein
MEDQNPRGTDTANWSLRSIDLLDFQGEKIDIVAVSSKNSVPFTLDAWVVADRPVGTTSLPKGNLPPQFWHGYRRQTVRLLAYSLGVISQYH